MHRILVIGYEPGIHGIATAARNLYFHLDRNAFQYDYLIRERSKGNIDRDLSRMRKYGAHIHYMDYLPTGFTTDNLNRLRELLISIPNICGVHVHDFALNVDPLILANEMKLPIKIIHSHVQATEEMIKKRRLSSLEKKKLNAIRSDRFVRLACSNYSGDYAFGGLSYTIIRNAIDVKRFSYNHVHRSIVRKSLNIPDNAPVLGFVGAHDDRKNPMFALRVFNAFHRLDPSSHMIITGNGYLFEDLKEYVHKEGLSEHTHFLGYQNEIELFFNAMDLLIVPSKSEGLPYALIEAQACGLQCLVSDSISRMSIITPLITMLPLKQGAFVWAETVYSKLNESQKRISDSIKITDAGYDIRETIKRIEHIYDSCLTNNAESFDNDD